MREEVEKRLGELARRAGLAGLPPTVVLAAAAVLVIAVVLALWRWWPHAGVEVVSAGGAGSGVARATPEARSVPGSATADGPDGGGAEGQRDGGTVTVHVVGAVLHPGVYELPGSARVRDAVGAAGGPTGNAAQAALNLARLLTDGEQITVPTQDEYARGSTGPVVSGTGAGGDTAAKGGAAATGGAQVNINTADAAALDALPGVGPSTAAKIVADREANGPFESADDLGRVTGIGPKKLEQLKDLVCVR